MRFILGVDLGYQFSDLDETLGVFRVYAEIMHRYIFDFRFQPQTGSELFFMNRKFQSSKPEAEKYLIGKLVGFFNESLMFVFSISHCLWPPESFLFGYVHILIHRKQ